MKNSLLLTLLCALGFGVLCSSCDKEKEQEYPKFDTMISAKDITVIPQILEAVGGKVPCMVKIAVPPYFTMPTAEVNLRLYLVWSDGESASSSLGGFIGEEAPNMGSKVISYKQGGEVQMTGNFVYVPEMRISELYIEFDVKYQGRNNVFRIKIADGVVIN